MVNPSFSNAKQWAHLCRIGQGGILMNNQVMLVLEHRCTECYGVESWINHVSIEMIIGARPKRTLLYSTKLRAILIRLATILLLTACSDSSWPSLSMTLGGIVTVEPDDVPVSVKARDRLLFLAVVQHPDGVKDLSIFGSGGKRCSQGIVGSLQSIGFTDSDEIEGYKGKELLWW